MDLDVAMERGFETSIKFKAKKQTMEMSDYEAMLTKEVAQRGGITRDRPRSFLTMGMSSLARNHAVCIRVQRAAFVMLSIAVT